jgi:hypothetical protein
MNARFKQEMAALWQEILRSDPKKTFGKKYKFIRDYNKDDWIAQPG